MELVTVWFILIAVLWIGYFVLEGFDFGVGALLRVIGRTNADRRAILTTLGPVWDGNEVWLLVAGGATFAAFPEWYATLFSGFYLPLFLILVALIVRGVAFEYRSKRADLRWRNAWDWAIVLGSALPALLWGVAFANIVRGVPLVVSDQGASEYAGTFLTLLNPYALLGGLLTLTVFLTHGTMFLTLKTDGAIRERSRRLTLPLGIVAAVIAVAFLSWTAMANTDTPAVLILAAAVAVIWLLGLLLSRMGVEPGAFAASAVAIALTVTTLFIALYPAVMPSTLDPAATLTIENASSTPYTLRIMTVVALIMTPLIVAYQAWSYWVFRKRISAGQIAHPERGTLDPVTS